MEPAIVARIFEPFFTTKDIGEGSGLGLAVVHGVIHNHGGAIAVTSTPGQGSTFTIYLPSLGAVFTPAATAEAPECSGSGQILIVDDEQAVATLLQQLLEDLGYVVVATTSSTAALSMVEQQPERFDAVITDQTMPELTGEQLARQLLTLRPELPIIVSTGFSSTLTKERAEELGIQGYLTKPFSRAQVGTLLQEVLTAKSTTAL
jgi:CheY-like chemotaxis protein